jgi:Fe-S-cluster containining protein
MGALYARPTVNRHERRKRASEARRAAKPFGGGAPKNHEIHGGSASRLGADLERVTEDRSRSKRLDPLSADVASELQVARTEEAAIRAATAAADAMDDTLAVVWSESASVPACKRGCSYCCTVRVSVTAPEVIRLVSYARETLPADELGRVAARAEANALRTHGATALGYPPRLDCAFLGADRSCRVHPARPLVCRREHAMDAAQCKAGYELAAPGKDHPIDRLVRAKLASDVVLDSYRGGLVEAGVDVSDYELQEAAHLALSDPRVIGGWLQGHATFASARLNSKIDEGQIRSPRAPRRLPPGA